MAAADDAKNEVIEAVVIHVEAPCNGYSQIQKLCVTFEAETAFQRKMFRVCQIPSTMPGKRSTRAAEKNIYAPVTLCVGCGDEHIVIAIPINVSGSGDLGTKSAIHVRSVPPTACAWCPTAELD